MRETDFTGNGVRETKIGIKKEDRLSGEETWEESVKWGRVTLPDRQLYYLFLDRQTDSYAPGAPQSQHTSFPGMRSTSSIMALVRSSSPSSPPPCSPLKAMLSASSLLLVNTEIHL